MISKIIVKFLEHHVQLFVGEILKSTFFLFKDAISSPSFCVKMKKMRLDAFCNMINVI